MVKAIFFDLDDTLLWDKKSVKTAFEKTCQTASERHSLDVGKLEEAVREEARQLYATYETYDFTKMIGINPFEGLWGTFDDEGDSFQKMKEIVPTYRQNAWTGGLKRMGIDDATFGKELAELFVENRKDSPFIYEETFSVLDKLKEDYQLVLITNGSPSLQQTKLDITPELVPYFDHIIISGGFGVGKPDRSIFEHALDLCQLKPEEALMVGDNRMTDILGANQTGIPSVWINRENDAAIEEVTPTYEIKHLDELYTILNQPIVQ
ncbi:HAD family hydrolase [Sporosarcina pasteurii]|uniref:Phosphoserine phosphatase n=1 Tax=Sporosarcina pasteurii TaxID=1474 RepID=A0A380C748_SPOPA|nr:HAD family hydrolase [Sporosarcina pasteurii]MDS9473026.1 HAD family hydrolase [Sporosarcina pasteurii]QBQ04535.1 HAD family hydrolase [Sporosarcina pasteurii]SUJ14200.1 Pyrimidine 5'-nucleotidase YjjG [Sporosarcina pasteurii]